MRTMLDAKECQCLTALVDCLIPADALGPSASDAGVVEFIRAQLDGSYGAGSGTHLPGTEAAPLDTDIVSTWTPRMFYRHGLAALQKIANKLEGGDFERLDEACRRRLLAGIEQKSVNHPWIALFLDQVLLNTMEGYFSDPIHGGNRHAAGWKMVGFPGCGHDYREFVGKNMPVSRLVPIRTIRDFRSNP